MTLKLLILLTTFVLLAYGNDAERKGNEKHMWQLPFVIHNKNCAVI